MFKKQYVLLRLEPNNDVSYVGITQVELNVTSRTFESLGKEILDPPKIFYDLDVTKKYQADQFPDFFALELSEPIKKLMELAFPEERRKEWRETCKRLN